MPAYRLLRRRIKAKASSTRRSEAFMAALDSMGKPALSIGKIRPTPGIVDEFYNDSTGEGEHGAAATEAEDSATHPTKK